MGKEKTFYQILGVSVDAKQSDIRTAYLAKARKLHPDNYQNSSTAELNQSEELMRQINQAWSTLSNEVSRSKYDKKLLSVKEQRSTHNASNWDSYQEWTPKSKPEKQATRYATQEEMKLTWFAKLVRPVPLFLILIGGVVAIAIVASLDNGNNTDRTRSVPVPTGVPISCMDFVAGSKGEKVPCGNHDAVIWTSVPAGESCPDDLYEVFNGRGGLFCFTYSDQG